MSSAVLSLRARALRKARHLAKKGQSQFRWLLARFAPHLTTEAEGRYFGPDGFHALLTVHDFEPRPRVSGTARFLIGVSNQGASAWKKGSGIKITLRWFAHEAHREEVILSESFQLELPALAPGKRRILSAEVPVPIGSVLESIVEFNLRENDGPWLAGADTAVRFPRHISGQDAQGAPADFDYNALYRSFQLDEDYWTVVGPATREEYEKLGQGNCDTLIQMGLNAHSRVLDVGCGTGQLTGPVARILGPQGTYYGTDVAGAAIDYCRRKFPLPNFHFLVNEQNAVPIEGVAFDIIYLGSVFTHMYPADIAGMLPHLKRLLAPNGFVLVDAFVSPKIREFVGSRAMIQLNEPRLQNQFIHAGFQFTETTSIAWNDHCRRVIYRLTHAG
jgi:SAM-dependent methyltransferase